MQAKLIKASSLITRLNDGITEILICPMHPDMWVEEYTIDGSYPDIDSFCGHCGGRCDDDCAVCFNA
jgi:hypothetical protein